jgi:hypothetical protein
MHQLGLDPGFANPGLKNQLALVPGFASWGLKNQFALEIGFDSGIGFGSDRLIEMADSHR